VVLIFLRFISPSSPYITEYYLASRPPPVPSRLVTYPSHLPFFFFSPYNGTVSPSLPFSIFVSVAGCFWFLPSLSRFRGAYVSFCRPSVRTSDAWLTFSPRATRPPTSNPNTRRPPRFLLLLPFRQGFLSSLFFFCGTGNTVFHDLCLPPS